MDTILARRGVVNYKVVSDETNNLPTDVDNGILNVDLFVQPTTSLEEINLRVIITNASIAVEST